MNSAVAAGWHPAWLLESPPVTTTIGCCEYLPKCYKNTEREGRDAPGKHGDGGRGASGVQCGRGCIGGIAARDCPDVDVFADGVALVDSADKDGVSVTARIVKLCDCAAARLLIATSRRVYDRRTRFDLRLERSSPLQKAPISA